MMTIAAIAYRNSRAKPSHALRCRSNSGSIAAIPSSGPRGFPLQSRPNEGCRHVLGSPFRAPRGRPRQPGGARPVYLDLVGVDPDRARCDQPQGERIEAMLDLENSRRQAPLVVVGMD